MGRPSDYNEEIATKICKRLAKGESLRSICDDEKMPSRITVHAWLLDKKKSEFLNQYETAVNVRTENMFDDLNSIADISDKKESSQRSRLRVDTRKWYLSKVMPKKYGDKMEQEITLNPQPIMDITDVQKDNGNEEDSITNEED